jgi:uncharacterized protein (TIGR00730 family)
MTMQRICVFCGSSSGADVHYTEIARRLGLLLVRQNLTLVYGGGDVGLMGVISHEVIDNKGTVIGVIPRVLKSREVANQNITELRLVNSMHERKAMMFELSDGFIALPGGMGTLEEFAEMITWGQLGIHQKPCGLLNVNGFYDPLIAFIDHAVKERFIKSEHRSLVIIEEEPELLLKRFREFRPHPHTEKWAERID